MILRAGLLSGALAVLATAPAAAQEHGLTAELDDRSLRYGQAVVVEGRLASGEEGRALYLQFRPRGATAWRTLKTVRTGEGGRYRAAAGLKKTGAVRVRTAAVSAAAGGGVAAAETAEKTVRVAAHLATTRRRLAVPVRRTAVVQGVLRPRLAGRVVRLQRRSGGRWRTVDRARTRRGGRFALSYRGRRPDSAPVRLKFSGDRRNTAKTRSAGRLDVLRRSFASYYGPGFYGQRTACGHTLGTGTLGVAHKTLPCGTRVTLKRGSRLVRVRVIDRGPFHPGREFDLTTATKRKLGFGSTGTVWVAH